MVAVDTETEGVEYHHRPFCVTMTWRDEEGALSSHYFELGYGDDVVKHILLDAPQLVMHNAKFDLQKLLLVGILDWERVQTAVIHDTECLAHLNDGQRRKGLKELARDILGEETDEEDAIKTALRQNKLRKADGYHLLPREVIIPYALKDTEFTLRLFEHEWPLLQRYPELVELYNREQKLQLVLLEMESRGLAVRADYLESTSREYADKILDTELDIADIAGEDFNPNSNPQTLLYFNEQGFDLEDAGRATLEKVDHPLAQRLITLRQLKKLHGTYLRPLSLMHREGVVHPWFRQHTANTGRMSSGGASA